LDLIKKLSITGKSTAEEQKSNEDQELENELNELLNDDFLLEFQKRRMKEMFEMSGLMPKFGSVISLTTSDEFLKAVDSENKNVTVVVHIYEEKFSACKKMNSCLNQLAKEYTMVKFCKILSTIAGLSKNFKASALPTLLVYKNGQVIGNFIRISNELGGDDFFSSDVESYLIEHSLLPDKTLMPVITQSTHNDDSDDDD
jgi:thiol-disulfide isomerase/thioredoxin